MGVEIDSEAIRVLAELLRETNLLEIEYQQDALKIKVSRACQQVVVPTTFQPSEHPEEASVFAPRTRKDREPVNLENHPGVIEAQMVGTVYLSPGPSADPFVTVGGMVSEGQTLFIIEAMKVMNMIKSPRSGRVKHIFVKDAQPVEYGDPIVIIE
ncbi:MAG: biotin/lipoyl-binding protein [Holosporaceae bacterium]|nr:biotin/lipoyl-binding protein [Holosporaceae bacterium]